MQDELYQWIADQEANVPPDEADELSDHCQPNGDPCQCPACQFVADTVNRMERGSWRRVKKLLEVDDVQGAD
jgi:hypothetical protein